MTNTEFLKENKGRWGIRQGGILVTCETFFTKQIAHQWARINYKGATNYEVEKIKEDTELMRHKQNGGRNETNGR